MTRYQLTMQQRHLSVIVGALRFSQQLASGNLSDTFGKVAMEAWLELPSVASGPYPARKGSESDVRAAVDETIDALIKLVWGCAPTVCEFANSQEGKLAEKLIAQQKPKTRRKLQSLIVSGKEMAKFSHAVEYELRTRIGHFAPMDDSFYAAMKDSAGDDVYRRRDELEKIYRHIKSVAWQLDHCGNYSPAFSYKTRFLYDIYQAFQHEFGYWRYSSIFPMLPRVPIVQIKAIG